MHEQFSRNPVIAETFNKIMFIEKLGEGWDRIMVEAKENPFKPKLPEIMDTGNTVIATLHSPEKFLNEQIMSQFEPIMNRLNERQKQAVIYLKKHNTITRAEYEKLTKTPKRTALNDIKFLQDEGIIITFGRSKAQYYTLAHGTHLARIIDYIWSYEMMNSYYIFVQGAFEELTELVIANILVKKGKGRSVHYLLRVSD